MFAARDNARDQAKKEEEVGSTGTDGSTVLTRMNRYGMPNPPYTEVLALGESAAPDIVLRMVVSDGVESRHDRIALFNPEARFAGLACASNPLFDTCA